MQGLAASVPNWPTGGTTPYKLLGNSMSYNVLQRLLIALYNHIGLTGIEGLPDPWATGQAQR